MLEATLKTQFVPGSNMKGHAAGGSWSYVLPTLERNQVLCIGLPSAATLATLARNAAQVTVLCRTTRQLAALNRLQTQSELKNVVGVAPGREHASQIAAGSCDVIFLADRKAVWRAAFSAAARARYFKWLTPTGHLYCELNGLESAFLARRIATERRRTRLSMQRFWITPVAGEPQTFVPIHDIATTSFFVRRRLTGVSSRSLRTTARAKAQQSSHESESIDKCEQRNPPALATSQSKEKTSQSKEKARTWRATIRQTARSLFGRLDDMERAIHQPRGIGKLVTRQGIVVGRSAEPTAGPPGPPAYVHAIAKECGVSLDGYRWGLSATGDYDSRKLVFFLFDRTASTPSYVVKMTRAAFFNARLEQETEALRRLEQLGIGDSETLPRIVFSGTHGGLAIVGETAIQGVPFDSRTTSTSNCPYARAAIEWLTELGASTATALAARPSDVASGLDQLLARFLQLYGATPEEESFLRGQLSVLDFNPLPLVFQHGDPGRWNVVVTSQGRISFLDWEAAEQHGLPLWDLFYFLRSFCMRVAESQQLEDRLRSFEQLFLNDSPVAELVIESVRNYCADTGLSGRLIEPLFYTCWMHRSLKESTRLPPSKLHEGHYCNLLKLCMARHESPTLQRLFSIT